MRPALASIDRLTIAYAAIALAFTLACGPRALPAALLLPLALCAVAALAFWIAPRARQAGEPGRLLAELYPLLLATGLYTEVGLVNAARGRSHDALVQRWEEAVFGGQLSMQWIRAFPQPLWSSVMHGAYLSYYGILAGAALGLWWSGRRAGARQAVFATMTTFYCCYSVFFLFPVAGPRYLLPAADNAATSVPLAVLAHRLLENGSAWGTAFPSSHVAAALVAAICTVRHWRALGAVLVPIAVLLSLSTVYCQFHYGMDALAGAVVAAGVLGLLPRGHPATEGVRGPDVRSM
jgi:membrane-associated phospholipid phosphatase